MIHAPCHARVHDADLLCECSRVLCVHAGRKVLLQEQPNTFPVSRLQAHAVHPELAARAHRQAAPQPLQRQAGTWGTTAIMLPRWILSILICRQAALRARHGHWLEIPIICWAQLS